MPHRLCVVWLVAAFGWVHLASLWSEPERIPVQRKIQETQIPVYCRIGRQLQTRKERKTPARIGSTEAVVSPEVGRDPTMVTENRWMETLQSSRRPYNRYCESFRALRLLHTPKRLIWEDPMRTHRRTPRLQVIVERVVALEWWR